MKFKKIKIRDDSFVGFSVGYVVVNLIFDVDTFFIEKFPEQNSSRKSEKQNHRQKFRDQNKRIFFNSKVCFYFKYIFIMFSIYRRKIMFKSRFQIVGLNQVSLHEMKRFSRITLNHSKEDDYCGYQRKLTIGWHYQS